MDLFEAFVSSQNPTEKASASLHAYFTWQTHQRVKDFVPGADDGVDLRTYLLYLRINGANWGEFDQHLAVLRQFYAWTKAEAYITKNPFDDFDHPFLIHEQISQPPAGQPERRQDNDREKLIALNQIIEILNSSVDIHSALASTLKTLTIVLDFQAGWVFMLSGSHLSAFSPIDHDTPGSFELVTAHDLPPGLEQNDRIFLRQPPACQCQHLLLAGRITHAVNIVECTRLHDSFLADGNNQGLRFHASMPLISQGKPVGLINVATAEWHSLTSSNLSFLSMVSAQVVVALERAHLYEISEARRDRLEKELQIAREVQAELMPREMPDIPGVQLAGAWHPASEVAGDLYDVFPLDENRWGIVIGDVSGKGTAAALYMAMIHSLILSAARRHPHPAAVLTDVNQTILRQTSTSMFVTVFLAVFDPHKQTLRYANAGHNPPIVRRASGTLESLPKTGSALGIFDDLPLSEATVTLEAGDAVVLYTDGVTEAWQPLRKQAYEISRLTAAISAAPNSALGMLKYLEADLEAFTNGSSQQDDITFLVLTRN